ncbi:hypothetical protein A5626_08350 [Mycobacterium marseillense]|uniref:Nuclear transport factor 2 family protein n=1 Tax=Mycobacterium marseillense TaxID=701042 RepID=A0AAC9YL11_9MYCO|nr:hypothetical protein [Mycobacterium marseillense]ASW90730.1 hypothetical protein CKJ54_13230 [Mycobacterium marseillense]MCA2266031.1 nuclear transport factor 2 family protein [Mycobacterium marseillense]OBJ67404.1 hypothetical protein A5626_08350 [Mycobacterium marseillense]
MAFDREDFDTFWQDWLEINREAQRLGDWGIMADFYEPDATYGYTYSAEDQYMNVGREEIRAGVLGLEMLGFQGWIYPYQAVIFDDRSGQAFGLWRQLTTFNAPDGQPYEIKGLGGSWFQYSGKRSWSWQRDMFDVGVATTAMLEVLRDGNNSPQLDERMKLIAEGDMPGHSTMDKMRAPLWPVPLTSE